MVALVTTVAMAQAQPKLSVSSARYGAAMHQTQKWGLVYSTIDNPTDQDVQVIALSRFKASPNLTYASTVWVPAGARRKVIQPLRTPNVDVPKARGYIAVELQTTLLNSAGTREFSREEALVSIMERSPTVVMIMDDERYDDTLPAMVSLGSPSKSAVDAEKEKKGARRSLIFPNLMIRNLRDEACPASDLGWDAVSYVCIAGRNPQLEPAQFDALRRYIVSGGRVWIMLDRVNPAFCRRLLGEDFTAEIVDRVQKHEVTFSTGSNRNDYTADLGETPVDMVRVAADGFDVMLTVDGWPAAMRREVGQGKLIVTTVGAKAWLDDENWDAEPLRDLSSTLYRPNYYELIPTERLATFAQGQIGYEIIDRNAVGKPLIFFAAALLIGGIVLARFGRLEWQAPAAVVLALVVTGVIMAMGKAHQSKSGTSPTIAGATWARADTDQQYATINGSLGFFSPTEVELPLAGQRGGVVWPDAANNPNNALRVAWSGSDQWQWQLPSLKPGVIQAAELHQTIPLEQQTHVRLSFTDTQLVGDIASGPFGTLTDLVLATPAGHMLPHVKDSTSFVIPVNQRSHANEFLGGQVSMTDTQARRQEMYRSLLNPKTRTRDNYYPASDFILMGWTSAVDNGISFVKDAQRRDEMLVSIPVTFVRPEPGTTFTIPPQLITRHWYRGPNGRSANIYDAATDQFIATRNVEQEFILGFKIPDALLPLEFDSLKLEVDIKAHDWTLQLLPTFGSNQPLTETKSPTGTVAFELTKYEGFEPDANGSIYVRCQIASQSQLQQTNTWDITQMRVTAKARVPQPKP